MPQEPKYPVQTVTKALDLIRALSQNSGSRGIGISEFSQILGLGKSTVHRLLDTLQYYGYVEKDPETNRYRLGWELYKIGQAVPAQNEIFDINRSPLLELGKKLNENVNYGTIKGKETVIISRVEDTHNGTWASVSPGEFESIHATALGKVMISELSSEAIYELLEQKEELPAYTANTISTVSELLKELQTVRRDGYAVDAEEYCLGLYCIAKPVRDYTGKIAAAVSVSMPVYRCNEKRKEFILESLGETTQKISKALGYHA